MIQIPERDRVDAALYAMLRANHYFSATRLVQHLE